MSTLNTSQLIQQLQNIAKKSKNDREYSASTRRSWEKKVNTALESLGIPEFKYLSDAKRESTKQKRLQQASKTLAKQLEQEQLRRQKQLIREQRLQEKERKRLEKYERDLRKDLLKQAKQNLQQSTQRKTHNIQDQQTGVNTRTQAFLHREKLLPERGDLMNMSLDQLEKARELMSIPMELRALTAIQDYAKDYLNTYFKGIADDPGIQERIDQLTYKFKGDYAELQNFLERTQESAFKGGYGDTADMLKNNANADISDIMYDRLERLENEYNIAS